MTTPTLVEALRLILLVEGAEAKSQTAAIARNALAAHDAQPAPVAAVQAVPVWPAEVTAWLLAEREARAACKTLNDRLQAAKDYDFGLVDCNPQYQAMTQAQNKAHRLIGAMFDALESAAARPIAQAAQRDALDAQRYRALRAGHAQAMCASLYGQDVPCDTPADWGRELDEWADAELSTDSLDAARASIEGAAKP
jgi:hypothetical protein